MCSRPARGRVDRLGRVAARVAVAVAAADALVAARAERPAAVLGRRAVAGEQHAPHVGAHPRVVERPVELVDRVRPERVAHLGPVERDAHRPGADRPVVGDVGQVEPRDRGPGIGVEDLGDHVGEDRRMTSEPGRLIDRAVPRWDFAERHARLVHAPPPRVWRALADVRVSDLPLTRLLMRVRTLGRRAVGDPDRRMLDALPPGEVARDEGREVLLAMVAPTSLRTDIRSLDDLRAASVDELVRPMPDGWVRIAHRLPRRSQRRVDLADDGDEGARDRSDRPSQVPPLLAGNPRGQRADQARGSARCGPTCGARHVTERVVFSIPMRTRFRGIDVREGMLLHGAGRVGGVLAVLGLRRARECPVAGRGARGGVRRVAGAASYDHRR